MVSAEIPAASARVKIYCDCKINKPGKYKYGTSE